MKALWRIFFVFLGLLIILVLSAYYVVSLPNFQKKLIEDRLPLGSSIHAVQITKESIELTDLSLSLPNGMVVQIGSLHSRFSIWSALFERIIFLRKIKLDELNIILPYLEPSQLPYLKSQESRSKNLSSIYYTLSRVLRFVEKGDWRFDVDPTQVSGVLTDASGYSHIFNLTATEVALGTETIVRANLDFGSKKTIQDGLKNYDLIINLVFAQKKEGGFHQIRLESLLECASASDDILLSFAHDLNLSLKSRGEIININFSFDSNIPHPEVFAPELTGIRDLSIKGDVKATFGGDTLILNAADVDIRMQDVAIATLKLKQSLKLNTRQSLVGELIKIDLVDFPLDLIGPWLGSGLQISGTPISTEVVIVGKSTGVLQLSALKPLQVGPFFMNKGKKMFLEEVIIRLNPFFDLDSEGVVRYDFGDIQILDRYGEIIQGRISGSNRFTSGNTLFSDSQADAQFKLGLSELFQQPVLAGKTNVMAGQAKLVFKIDSKKKYPIKLQANITGLRAGDISGLPKQCSLLSQLKKNENGEYISESEFSFGSKDAPNSNVQITTQAMPSHKAIPFKFSLSAPKVSQTDIDFLYSALKPQEEFFRGNLPSQNTKTSKQNSKIPYWTNLHGEALIKLDQFIMSSGNTINGISFRFTISEPSSSIKQIDASVKSSVLTGKAKVTYNFKDTSAYQTSSSLSFNNVDPSIFSNKSSKSLPLKGSFDGSFNLNGKGVDLKASLENAKGDFTITSYDGIFTAFELDERSKLGLLGASILGQSLNRPGITAMSLAIPYFKDIHFDSFALKLDKPEDKTINISKLLIQGDNLRINGKGSIAATKLNELIKKPLMLTLEFGARGRLIDYLETLGLLTPMLDTNGFRTLNKSIKIGGTLSNPDTSALKQVLNHAASRALEQTSIRKLIP